MKSRYIQDFELKKIIKHVPKEQRLPFRVAVATGLRVGDIVKLSVSDIDDERGGINYTAEKTGKRGFAKLSKSLRIALKENAREGFCFPSDRSRSGHITRQAIWRQFKNAAIRSGVDIDGVSPHSLRKNFAVDLYKEGGIKAVQTAMQHDRADTTQIYACADFGSGENALKPLLRGDLELIVKLVVEQTISVIQSKERSKKRGA